MNKIGYIVKLVIICAMFLIVGCGTKEETVENPTSRSYTFEEILWPSADGINVQSDDCISVDYSNSSQGYFMMKSLNENHAHIKLQVICNNETYTYDLNKELEYEVYPFNMGDGTYTIRVLEQVEDTQYVLRFALDIEVQLEDEFTPYLYPSQIVDYDENTLCLEKSFELTKDDTTELERVESIYTWVIHNVVYDWDKVEEVQGKYVLPILDDTYTNLKGICFDYAALMAAMLRVQHIPTKVVTGMVEEGYHAWIEVYIENVGWIKPHIYFHSSEWTRMDPTFDAQDAEYDGDYDTIYTY